MSRPRDEIMLVRILHHCSTSGSRSELKALSLASSTWCCLKMEACLFDSEGRLRGPVKAPCSPHARVIRPHLPSLCSVRGQKEVCMPMWRRGPLDSEPLVRATQGLGHRPGTSVSTCYEPSSYAQCDDGSLEMTADSFSCSYPRPPHSHPHVCASDLCGSG
jgi:hypothetical protein